LTEPPSWPAPSGDQPDPPPPGYQPPPGPPPPPSYGAPQYGAPPPYGAPQYGAPQYGAPQYGAPQYGAPQYGAPQYGAPQGYPSYQQPYAVAAPKPGIIPLRPLTVAEILDGAFATIRRHPRATLGVAAVAACVQEAILLLVRAASGTLTKVNAVHFTTNTSSQPQSPDLAGVYVTDLVTLLVAAVIGALLTGVLCLVVSDSILGQPTSARSAWARLRPMAGRLIVVSFLAALGEFVGLAFCLAPGVYLWGIWALVVPALVLERTSIRSAFSRSRKLVKGSFWRVWGIRALGTLVAGVVGGVLGAIGGASALSNAFNSSSTATTVHVSTTAIVLQAVLGVAALTFTGPFLAGMVTLLYVDRRIRVEALDVQLQQAAAAPAGLAAANRPFG
jgi:hypothetical protein